MDIFIIVIVIFLSLLMAHTYIFYPILLAFLIKNKYKNLDFSNENLAIDTEKLPFVSVLIAAYNEEKIISQKLNSLLQIDYPYSKIHFFIGSDFSTDQTNLIINSFKSKIRNLHFFEFKERRGKPSILNDLAAAANKNAKQLKINAKQHIFILNDANVIPQPQSFSQLGKHFYLDKNIGLVDSLILPFPTQQQSKQGIFAAEQNYLSTEAKLKHREGELWGLMLGAMGGCYALRADLFKPIPKQVLVDDFYIAMSAFQQNIKAISELKAICYEKNPGDLADEFRRKTRIAAGNFYNLGIFSKFIFSKENLLLSFVFISHKLLRWLGGFIIVINYFLIMILFLIFDNLFYQYLFIATNLVLFATVLLDFILKKLDINIRILRFLAYFILMNLAFIIGFYKYWKGENKGIWTPTKR